MGGIGHRDRYKSARTAHCAGIAAVADLAWIAQSDTTRQWPRTSSTAPRRLMQRQEYRTAFHPAGQAESECFHLSGLTDRTGPKCSTAGYLHRWTKCGKSSINGYKAIPGKPMQNAYIESFNGRFRDECLNDHWFTSLYEARIRISAWRRDYN